MQESPDGPDMIELAVHKILGRNLNQAGQRGDR
jgi:hypothetical protein